MAVLLVYGLYALLLQVVYAQQKDPLKDFCRRFGHQTTVIDRKLYIDGGLVNYNPLPQNPLNYTNTNLLYAALDVDNDGMPNEYDNLTKPASAPSVEGGVLWADSVNKYFYLYGGDYYQNSPQPFSTWQYDIINNNWTSLDPDGTEANIERASYGAGAVAEDSATGFWYGGWLTNQSVPSFGSTPIALSNLLQYNMLKNSWTNSTGPDTVGRAEGVMVYIPASDGGMLVYFGGVQQPYPNGSTIAQTMDDILIYDIANAKWYTQKATGQVPESRRRFCAGATWAQDQSSYNIYLYGGASVPEGVGYDDIYILSIPTFTWIKWYPTTPGTGYPHHSLSCNVIDGGQMLVMGGTFENSSQCDVPTLYGFHNMDLGKQSGSKWAEYRSNITSYKVPSEIIAVVGGSDTGGATNKTPSDGFADRDLSAYFTRTYTPSVRAATRAIPSATSSAPSPTAHKKGKSTPVGAIAGGVVGGVLVLLAVIGAVIFCCVRARKNRAVREQHTQQYHNNEQKPVFQPHPMSSPPMGQAPPYVAQLHGSESPYVSPVELPSTTDTQVPGKLAQHSYAPVSNRSQPHSPAASPPHSPPANPMFPIHSQEATTPPVSFSPYAAPGGYPSPHLQTQYPSPQQQYIYPQEHYPPPHQQGSPPPQAYPPTQQYFPPTAPSPSLTPRSAPGHSISPPNVGPTTVPRKEVPVQLLHNAGDSAGPE